MPVNRETYYVVNEDELDATPRQIYFGLEDAQSDGAEHIDVFDDLGNKMYYYEREGTLYKKYECIWLDVNHEYRPTV